MTKKINDWGKLALLGGVILLLIVGTNMFAISKPHTNIEQGESVDVASLFTGYCGLPEYTVKIVNFYSSAGRWYPCVNVYKDGVLKLGGGSSGFCSTSSRTTVDQLVIDWGAVNVLNNVPLSVDVGITLNVRGSDYECEPDPVCQSGEIRDEHCVGNTLHFDECVNGWWWEMTEYSEECSEAFEPTPPPAVTPTPTGAPTVTPSALPTATTHPSCESMEYAEQHLDLCCQDISFAIQNAAMCRGQVSPTPDQPDDGSWWEQFNAQLTSGLGGINTQYLLIAGVSVLAVVAGLYYKYRMKR